MDKKWDNKLNSRLWKRFCAVGLASVLGAGLVFNSAFAAQPTLNSENEAIGAEAAVTQSDEVEQGMDIRIEGDYKYLNIEEPLGGIQDNGGLQRSDENSISVYQSAEKSEASVPISDEENSGSIGKLEYNTAYELDDQLLEYTNVNTPVRQFACEAAGGIYFLQEENLWFLNLSDGSYSLVYTFDTDSSHVYCTENILYWSYNGKIVAYNLKEKKVEKTITSDAFDSSYGIGVDSEGRIYVQADKGMAESRYLYLLSPDGDILDKIEITFTYSFAGFGPNGTFYFVAFDTITKSGIEHDVKKLCFGQVQDNKFVPEQIKGIESVAELGVSNHQDCAVLFANRYLSDNLGNVFDVTPILDGEIIHVLTFDHEQDEEISEYNDLSSVGTRTLYNEENDTIIGYTSDKNLFEYDLSSREAVRRYDTAHYVFSLLDYNDLIVAIEREAGEFYIELIPKADFHTVEVSTIDLNETDTYSQHTKELVQEKWENAQISSEIKVYEKEYSFSPYSEAAYTKDMKNALMNFSNYLRWLGGLTTFDSASDEVWSNAAKGAVLCQKNGDISHEPEQPDDMSDEFYDAAYQACSSSNLSQWYGAHTNAKYFMDDIVSFLDDTSNVGSYELGHRFEFLQRAGYQIAYGSTEDILLQTVEDYNGQVNRTGTINGVDNNDYCYPWPAAGAFPTDAISTKALWSFNLNTDKIDFSGADIIISITDLDTGKTIDVTDTIGTSAYLGGNMYFKGKCFYFQGPEVDSFDGKHYQVTITGMALSNGDPAEITYTVDFFDPEKVTSDKLEGVSCVGASLNLEGKIGVNYYLKLSDAVLKDRGAYVEFVLPDDSVTKVAVSEGELNETTEEYKFTAEVAAKEMAETIQCKVVDSSGKTSDVFEYSVIKYAKYVLEHESDYTKLVPLVRAMLTYGGAAQIHFGYQVDNLADADITLTAEEETLLNQVAEKVADCKSSVEGEASFVHAKSVSLTLESETEINYFFECSDGTSANDLTFTCDGKTLEPVMMDDETCKVTVNRIPAKNLDEMFTVKVTKSSDETYYSATYGPYVYIHTALSGSGYSDDLKELCKALYWYSQAANTYFQNS